MASVRLPIINVLMNGDFTCTLLVGAAAKPLNVILDTGSSALAVSGHAFDPMHDAATKTTNIAQAVAYGSGSWVGAVVETTVGFSAEVSLAKVKLAVTYRGEVFGQSHGIFGLAYPQLENAYRMPVDTWKARYDYDHVQQGQPATIDPYFSQLEQAGGVKNKFAFAIKRSTVSYATPNPATDPANQGVLVVGGGEEETDLYTGAFTQIAIVDDLYYNTALLSVRVGSQPPIPVSPLPANSPLGSNSIVDSGTNGLALDQPLYDRVIAAFRAIDPKFADALRSACYANDEVTALDQTQLDLAVWPSIVMTFQGVDGKPASVAIAPTDYWQFDAGEKGKALTTMYGDNGSGGGMSILGLPLFTGYYVVFDRAANNGQGSIGFAKRA